MTVEVRLRRERARTEPALVLLLTMIAFLSRSSHAVVSFQESGKPRVKIRVRNRTVQAPCRTAWLRSCS